MARMMRVAVVAAPGGPEAIRIGEAPVPEVGPGLVLIRVAAAGVNRPDLLQRAGGYAPPPDASPVLGLEVAGTVAALGEGAAGFAVGDPVTALANGGGYAEFAAVPAGQCLPVPAGMDPVRAACLPENLFTVWSNLWAPPAAGGAGLAAGEAVLVHGGTSGIGLAALGLARALGVRAVATAGTAEKCRIAERHGAVAAWTRDADWVAGARAATGGRGVDAVLDTSGAAFLGRNLEALGTDGRLVLIGLMGGAVADGVPLATIMRKRLRVTGSMLRPRTAADKARIAAALRETVWPLLAAGAFGPVIDRVFPFAEAAAAHAHLEGGSVVGKVALRMDAAA